MMYMQTTSKVTLLAILSCGALVANANQMMPDFGATVPGAWTTDRYEPASFTTVDGFQGRDGVLAIGVGGAGDWSTRPAGQQSAFYNTQGRKYTFASPEGVGSQLSADLYIPASWSNSAEGYVRTDMWGTLVNGADAVSAYPILGFSNYGGAARLRVWDGASWVNLSSVAVDYDSWTAFQIELTASELNFYVNGILAYTDTTLDGSLAFKEVIMQSYNFTDPALSAGAQAVPYIAHWSNLNVPDAGSTLGILGFGFGLMAFVRRRTV